MKLKMHVKCHVFIVFMMLLASAPAAISAQDEVNDSAAYSRLDEVQQLEEVVVTAPVRSKVKSNPVKTCKVESDSGHVERGDDKLFNLSEKLEYAPSVGDVLIALIIFFMIAMLLFLL